MYLGELGPPLGKIGMIGGTCPSLAFFVEEVKLSTIFSLGGKNLPFRGVNLLLGEKALFLEEYSLNLLVSFPWSIEPAPWWGRPFYNLFS